MGTDPPEDGGFHGSMMQLPIAPAHPVSVVVALIAPGVLFFNM
jgi:hypothetical protein